MKILQAIIRQLLLCTLLCISLCLGLATICSGVVYEYIELLPEGWTSSTASRINNNGAVLGGVSDGNTSKIFIYDGGEYLFFNIPTEWVNYNINGFNDNNVVIGTVYDALVQPTQIKGFIYKDGEFTFSIPDGLDRAYFNDINNNNVVVGFGFDRNAYFYRSFIYNGSEYIFLPQDVWSGGLYAQAINDNGDVAGSGKIDSMTKGFIYSDGQYTDILPPPGWESAYPQAINNNKMIAGYGYSGGTKYFIYSEGNYTVVTMLGDINNNGIMAGSGNDGSTTKGCIFDGVKYTYFLPYGWENASFLSINDSNIVAGSGTDSNGITKAFIGIPLAPTEQIQAIILFYDNGIANSTMYGIGKGKAGEKKLNEFKQMLLQAQIFIENQNIIEACQQLKEVYSRVDGVSRPSDYVKGSAAPELAAKIDALIKNMCIP